MPTKQKIWLVTGVSSGLGRALADYAARNNCIVVGTVRKKDQLAAFNNLVQGNTIGALMDLKNPDEIKNTVDMTVQKFGRIDVLVNNAGYGLLGAVEEINLQEAREQMETNFFGLFLMTKAVLPVMRNQRSGNIVQISSAGGFHATPGMSLYNASKFAVQGLSEALAIEVEPLKIRVTIVEPGPFRTQFASTSSRRAVKKIDDYAGTSGALIETIYKHSGKQDGDPEKAAPVIFTAVNSKNPPLHLPLGNFALNEIRSKIQSVETDIKQWNDLITRTSFDQ